jgi:hypothetical protein
MPHTGAISFVSGIYRSDCCGVERAVSEKDKFPPCDGGQVRLRSRQCELDACPQGADEMTR